MGGGAQPVGVGADDEDGHFHWVLPSASGAQYVPDAGMVAAIVRDLSESQWLRWEQGPPYNPDGPFYYASFEGATAPAWDRSPDGTVRTVDIGLLALLERRTGSAFGDQPE